MEAVRQIRGVNSELTHPVSPALERIVDRAVQLRERRLAHLPAELGRRLLGWWRLQQTLRALNRLDDRELTDIGLRRVGLRDLVAAHLRRQR